MSAITDVHDVIIDARNPQRVFAASAQGVWRSDDAAQSWAQTGTGLSDALVTLLAQHPLEIDRLYAATGDGHLFRTDDAATTWHPTR